jgi:hypothetical protein
VVDARTPTEAQAAIVMVQAAQDEDDIKASLDRMFGGKPWYRSKKVWLSLLGTALPIVLQATTGAVTWPVAAGLGVASIVTFLLSQAGVDKASANAAAQVTQTYVAAKLAKK